MWQLFSRKTFVIACLCAAIASRAIGQQTKMDERDLGKTRDMLQIVYTDLKKNYFDPKYGGMDIDARYRDFNTRLASAATLNAGMVVVAGYLDGLKDSHTFFIPPMRPYTLEPGFRMEMVGDQCLITRLRPTTDAASKLHPGDRILTYNTYNIDRAGIRTLGYYFTQLNPTPVYELNVQSPDGATRHVSVNTFIKKGKGVMDLSQAGPDYWDLIRRGENEDHVSRSVLTDIGDVTIWKLPEFNLEEHQVNEDFARIKKHSALVLDLRGNPGGAVDTLKWMLENVFDHDVKIADRVTRKDSKPMVAKAQTGVHPFTGKIVVLIDSESASAAELFARVMQLEHRGTVIGDKSSGSVMESQQFSETGGGDTTYFFGVSVTDANLIMTDGKSLEKAGVTPDEVLLPTAHDVAGGLDPVLSHAAEVAGAKLSPESAGKLFPVEWLPL